MAGPREGALAEFGRRPLGFKVGVFAGIAAVLGLLYFQFMLRPLQKKVKAAEQRSVALQQEASDLQTQIDAIQKLVDKRAVLEKQLADDRNALPTGAELPAFFDTLNRKVGDAGVEVKRWEYKKEVPVEDFYRVPIDVELTGTFQQLKRFFASLLPHDAGSASDLPQEKERIITIEDLTLSDPTPKNGDLVLTAKFTASTFRQDETKEQPGAPGAAGATGSAATPAGAGSGSASTAPTGAGAGSASSAGSASGSGSASGASGSGSASGAGPMNINLPSQVKQEVQDDMKTAKDRSGPAHIDPNAKLKGGM